MQEMIRGHIRSNVVGYVALFIALSGTAYANHEDIFSDDIVDGEVKNVDLAANSVGTAKIANGSVQGIDVLDNTIAGPDIQQGGVRSADLVNDTNSGALTGTDVLNNGLTGDDINESSLGFECPGGYELAGKDVCYEPEPGSAAHTNADFATALSTCAGNGDRLPTLAEGWAVMTDLPTPGDEEFEETWTADHNGAGEAIILRKNEFGVISRSSASTFAGTTTPRAFRCVTSPHG